MSETEPEWEPGDPLFPRHPYSSYFFNYRHDSSAGEPVAPDGARWPEPFQVHDLDRGASHMGLGVGRYADAA